MNATPTAHVPAPTTPNTAHPVQGVDFNHPCAGKVEIIDHDKAMVNEYEPDGVTERRKVAIVGFAMSSAMAAPFNDPTYSIWGMNQLYRHIPRADRWFEIHHNWHEHVVDGTDHLGWLQSFPGPVYNSARIPQVPNSVLFPRRECEEIGTNYWTSSIAFMIALAIRDGFTTIELYGIDLIVGEEYAYQKPCAEFWIGIANGRGITVGTHRNSALLKHDFCYGFESEPPSLVLLSELHKRHAWLTQEKFKHQIALANLDGALQDTEMWLELATLRSRHATVAYEPPKG
jgi:hypothetical protein